MRHRSDGPKVMDFLFVSLFMRGKEQGYARFNLGMAPLASVGEQRGAHARERLARLLFQRGEHWYNFQGLRAYKDKFDPRVGATLHGVPGRLGMAGGHRVRQRADRGRLGHNPHAAWRGGRDRASAGDRAGTSRRHVTHAVAVVSGARRTNVAR